VANVVCCQKPDTIGVFFVPFFSVFEIFQQRDLDVFDFFSMGIQQQARLPETAVTNIANEN